MPTDRINNLSFGGWYLGMRKEEKQADQTSDEINVRRHSKIVSEISETG